MNFCGNRAETEFRAEIDREWDGAWAAQMNEEKEK